MTVAKKALASAEVPKLLSRFLANGHLLQLSCQSANDRGDDEVKPEVMHIHVYQLGD